MGHHGITQTLKKLKAAGSQWNGMRGDVAEFIRQCVISQKSRDTVREGSTLVRHVIECYEPFEEILVDFMVNLPVDEFGYRNICRH